MSLFTTIKRLWGVTKWQKYNQTLRMNLVNFCLMLELHRLKDCNWNVDDYGLVKFRTNHLVNCIKKNQSNFLCFAAVFWTIPTNYGDFNAGKSSFININLTFHCEQIFDYSGQSAFSSWVERHIHTLMQQYQIPALEILLLWIIVVALTTA